MNYLPRESCSNVSLTFKMASFSVKHEKDSKCRSLNSPLFVKKFSRSQKLRADALGWDGWRKEPFESNQSLINNLHITSLDERDKMEPVSASGCNLYQFENEPLPKHPTNQVLINAFEASFMSDNLLSSTPNLSTSVPSEPNSTNVYISKAIFTIHQPSSQILVVNSAACQLLNYSSDELCSMKLENLVIDCQKHKVSNLYEKFLKSLGEIPHSNGKLLEFVRKDGETILVSVYLKRLDNPERCLAIVESIDRKTGLVSVDESGKITSCDENIALIFQYDSSECIGTSIYSLLPAVNLSQRSEGQWKDIERQQLTGRTKNGEAFPVTLAISCGNIPLEEYKIMLWICTSLRGLIFLNKKLLITDFNGYFIKLLFGFTKKEIINQPVASLIPTFCKDIGFESSLKDRYESSGINDTSLSFWCKKNESFQDCSENSVMDDSLSTVNKSKSFSLSTTTDSSKQCDWSGSSFKGDSEREQDLKTLFTHLNIDTVAGEKNSSDFFKVSFPSRLFCEGRSTHNKRFGKFDSEQRDKIFDSFHSNYENIMVQEGKFLGYGLHIDGSYIDIQYQVNNAATSEESFYCVWLSRDMFKFSDLNRGSTSNMVTYFNNTSVDGSLQKDSICSGQYTRPSTASLISQCDENLTAGDYSQFYTNIRQIGKGAFGYVKMAFRNLDGLLVVTKFIKKQSISIRSWVFHSNLNMKIPLEISLLTTLHHPNIVKVLDVFHNDSFVQLVMEKHGAGFDLFEFINRGPKCDEKLKSYIFRQIISAVHYLDSLGILHRDIKDENVIINEKFEIKLIDFGSATFMPPNETFSKFYGTVEYCSPEVLQGNSYKGPELEIWALGVTLYVLTFGENPFSNIEGTIKAEFSLPLPISMDLDDLLHQMLDKNVETRITIDKVVLHSWINQPVSVENYKFEEVVKCSDEEAYPPKYVHEIKSEDLYAKDSRTDSNHLEDTNNSNSSLQNLAEIDDLDDNFKTEQKCSFSDLFGSKGNASSVMLSSRSVQWKNDRLSKSTTSVPNRFDKFPSLSESGFECRENAFLKSKNLGNFENTSSSENESEEAKVVHDFIDLHDSELKMQFKSCFLEEDYLNTSDSSEVIPEVINSVNSIYELLNENGCAEFSGAEGDTDKECVNPN